MAKKPGTLLREYSEKYLKHLSDNTTIIDGNLSNPVDHYNHYTIHIEWMDCLISFSASRDNILTIGLTRLTPSPKLLCYRNITGYYAVKSALEFSSKVLSEAAYSFPKADMEQLAAAIQQENF